MVHDSRLRHSVVVFESIARGNAFVIASLSIQLPASLYKKHNRRDRHSHRCLASLRTALSPTVDGSL